MTRRWKLNTHHCIFVAHEAIGSHLRSHTPDHQAWIHRATCWHKKNKTKTCINSLPITLKLHLTLSSPLQQSQAHCPLSFTSVLHTAYFICNSNKTKSHIALEWQFYFQESVHATAAEAKATQVTKLVPNKDTVRKHTEGLLMKVLDHFLLGSRGNYQLQQAK